MGFWPDPTPFPVFLLQVTSRDESSGPRLIPFLLIKMINKSRESHSGVPSASVQAGMGSLGNLRLEIWGLDAASLWFQLSEGVLGYHERKLWRGGWFWGP